MVDAISGDDRAIGALTHLERRRPLRFRRIVVIGGGCYGSWYTQQLARAALRGALEVDEVVVVDRNPACAVLARMEESAFGALPVRVMTTTWAEYVAVWLTEGADAVQYDAMVPSPLMPHLCLDWLIARARARWADRTIRVEPLASPPDTPWQRAAPDGRHYVSFATWTCPVNCIEPARCPATRGTRDWTMPDAITTYVREQECTPPLRGPIIFHCTHRTFGVGMIDAIDLVRADEQIASWADAEPLSALVGTVSHCHGALGVLSVS
jgi:hypothetical protein